MCSRNDGKYRKRHNWINKVSVVGVCTLVFPQIFPFMGHFFPHSK